jgi:hypothetical protein
MACEDPKHLAEFPMLSATATKLHREAGTQYAMLLQRNVVLGDEQVLVVAAPGTRGKFRTQPMHEGDEITRHDRSLLALEQPLPLREPSPDQMDGHSSPSYLGGAGIAEE